MRARGTPRRKRAHEESEISIGKLARAAGLSTATIHFYVSTGLLPPARKLSRTRAAYSNRHLRVLGLIRRMKNVGYSLEQVKLSLRQYGSDDEGLAKLEGLGSLQPLPPPKTDRDQEPIDLFDPVDRSAILEKAGCPPELLDELLARGFLRPLHRGLFDARDLWMLRTIVAMHRDGVTAEERSALGALLDAARAALPILRRRGSVHQDALRARRLRFSDLLEPFQVAVVYYLDRLATEEDPSWREELFLGARKLK
jgi:DNA-binding transcriptional MerR regulator